jgi:hypothetical protein
MCPQNVILMQLSLALLPRSHLQQLADLGHLLALTEFNIGSTQLGNNLIHCVTFLRHSGSLFRAVRPIKIFSLTMVQFYGRSVMDIAELRHCFAARAELSITSELSVSGVEKG